LLVMRTFMARLLRLKKRPNLSIRAFCKNFTPLVPFRQISRSLSVTGG
jgi:hypothetical protein